MLLKSRENSEELEGDETLATQRFNIAETKKNATETTTTITTTTYIYIYITYIP